MNAATHLVACPDCAGTGAVGQIGTKPILCNLCDGKSMIPAEWSAAGRSVDYIARLAEAWDGTGRQLLTPGSEQRALLALAYLPAELETRLWRDLTAEQRRRLMGAARRAVEFGRTCAWVFGEGRGA